MKWAILLCLNVATLFGQLSPIPGGTYASNGSTPPAVTANQIQCTGTTSPITCTLPSTPTNGNCLIAWVRWRTVGTTTDVTSVASTNATWASTGAATNAASGMTMWVGAVAASPGSVVTVTQSSGGGVNNLEANVVEATGIPACSLSGIDAAAVFATSTSVTPATGAYTTTHANDLLLYGAHESSGNCAQWTATPGAPNVNFTCMSVASADSSQTGYKILSSSGAQSESWTTNNNFWRTSIVALKGN